MLSPDQPDPGIPHSEQDTIILWAIVLLLTYTYSTDCTSKYVLIQEKDTVGIY